MTFQAKNKAASQPITEPKQQTAEPAPRQFQSTLQQKANASARVARLATMNERAASYVQRQPNRTGMPDQLKNGIENLSGYAMDDVKVHYNSPKPAQLQAHAYAQGTDIHLAPGQEKYLPHEAWHVVQQKQGRVQPTMQMKGVQVNDNKGLEREADVMGAISKGLNTIERVILLNDSNNQNQTVQRCRYPLSGSKRVLKPTFESAIAGLNFWEGPTYVYSGIHGAGGKKSEVVLGPTGAWLNAKSDADSSLPSGIRAARNRYPQSYLKAGHLLNAQFGGDGKNANNLTILSATGNSNHKAFDEPIKRALTVLKEAFKTMWEDGINIQTIEIGIEVIVKVNTDQPWQGERIIFNGLECTACVTEWKFVLKEFEDKILKEKFLTQITEVEKLCIDATLEGEINNPT